VDEEQELANAATGDIVLARSAQSSSESFQAEDWNPVGVVIRPADMGVSSIREPVVFTERGLLGQLMPTISALGYQQLCIAAGPAQSGPYVMPHFKNTLRATLTSAHVEPVDETAATVLRELRAHGSDADERSEERVVEPPAEQGEPGSGLRHIMEIAYQGGYEALLVRKCIHGKTMPCYRECP
jgi:hypothetical protein